MVEIHGHKNGDVIVPLVQSRWVNRAYSGDLIWAQDRVYCVHGSYGTGIPSRTSFEDCTEEFQAVLRAIKAAR